MAVYRMCLHVFVIVGCLMSVSESIRFNLESGDNKCVYEEIKVNSMSVGSYSVVNPNENNHPLPDSHKIVVRVSSPKSNIYHAADNVHAGQFSFQAAEPGDYVACFWTDEHKPAITLTVDFEWKTGMATKTWSYVAKKGSVDAMELEVKKLIATVESVREEIFYLREREEEMQKLNTATNSSMGWLSLLSFLICLSVSGVQIWHLRSFFKKRKLI